MFVPSRIPVKKGLLAYENVIRTGQENLDASVGLPLRNPLERSWFHPEIPFIDIMDDEEFKKFSKSTSPFDEILETAGEMRNIKKIKSILYDLMKDPPDWSSEKSHAVLLRTESAHLCF